MAPLVVNSTLIHMIPRIYMYMYELDGGAVLISSQLSLRSFILFIYLFTYFLTCRWIYS